MTYVKALWLKRTSVAGLTRFIANGLTVYGASFLACFSLLLSIFLLLISIFSPDVSLSEAMLSCLAASGIAALILTAVSVFVWAGEPLLIARFTPARLQSALLARSIARVQRKLEAELELREETEAQLRKREELQAQFIEVAEKLAEAQGQNTLRATVSAHEALDLLTSRA